MKNKVTLSLILIFLVILLFSSNFIKSNEKPDNYKYLISLVKTDKTFGKNRQKNVLQYYGFDGEFLFEEVIIDTYDPINLTLEFYLKTEDSLYSYGDRGIYITNLENLITTKVNDLKVLSRVYENENKEIFILENSGTIESRKGYYNTIYKNNIKLIDIEGLIIDFLILNEYIYYQTIIPYNQTANRYVLNTETMNIEKIDYDESGVFIKVNNEVYLLTTAEFAYRVSDNKKIRQLKNFSKFSSDQVFYNNYTNKSYYEMDEIIIENETLIFTNMEKKGVFYSRESDKYFDINYNDGILSINGKENKINNKNTEYRLLGVFEK